MDSSNKKSHNDIHTAALLVLKSQPHLCEEMIVLSFSLLTIWVNHYSPFHQGSPPFCLPPPEENLISLFQVVVRLFFPRCVILRPNLPVSSVTAQTTESYSSIPRLKYLRLYFPFRPLAHFSSVCEVYIFFHQIHQIHNILRNVLFEFVHFNLCIWFYLVICHQHQVLTHEASVWKTDTKLTPFTDMTFIKVPTQPMPNHSYYFSASPPAPTSISKLKPITEKCQSVFHQNTTAVFKGCCR